jgi:4'-phosphopantetheinyl transferase
VRYGSETLSFSALPADVEVWRVTLRPTTDRLACAWKSLDEHERARADGFRFEADRVGYVAAHGALRCLLAMYLDLEPEALRFVRGPAGKPSLDSDLSTGLEFNLSHSGDRGLIAICRGGPVGVDLEKIRPGFDYAGIADRYLASEERVRLRCAGPGTVQEFFRLWTRKEALWKACGLGLAAVERDTDPAASAEWTVREIAIAPDYAAAVCAPGPDWALHCMPFDVDD